MVHPEQLKKAALAKKYENVPSGRFFNAGCYY